MCQQHSQIFSEVKQPLTHGGSQDQRLSGLGLQQEHIVEDHAGQFIFHYKCMGILCHTVCVFTSLLVTVQTLIM